MISALRWRSVREIVDAAVQEDAQGIAVSSYQGGHIEFFKYMVDLLKERGSEHIRVFGGGGGTITPEEIRDLIVFLHALTDPAALDMRKDVPLNVPSGLPVWE